MSSKEAIESEQAGTPTSWLQECCISLSPSNDTLAITRNDKAVFLASKLQYAKTTNRNTNTITSTGTTTATATATTAAMAMGTAMATATFTATATYYYYYCYLL